MHQLSACHWCPTDSHWHWDSLPVRQGIGRPQPPGHSAICHSGIRLCLARYCGYAAAAGPAQARTGRQRRPCSYVILIGSTCLPWIRLGCQARLSEIWHWFSLREPAIEALAGHLSGLSREARPSSRPWHQLACLAFAHAHTESVATRACCGGA